MQGTLNFLKDHVSRVFSMYLHIQIYNFHLFNTITVTVLGTIETIVLGSSC